MKEEVRKSCISKFKKIITSDEFFKSNPDIKRILELVIKEPHRLLDKDDTFNFDNGICLKGCDGHCCFNIDMVRVSPIDVDYMVKSPLFKDLTRKQVVEQYLELFLGGESLIPMAIIKMHEENGLRICPFIVFARKFGVENNFIEDNGVGGICLLGQQYKPSICLLYPLGRINTTNTSTNTNSVTFIRQDCEGTNTNKKVYVKDHIADYIEKSKINDKYVSQMSEIIKRLKDTFQQKETIRLILTQFLYYLYLEEEEFSSKLVKISKSTDNIIKTFKSFCKNPYAFLDKKRVK